MTRFLDFNPPFSLEESSDILDKLARAIYHVLQSEDLFYMAMHGANERGFQYRLFQYLNQKSEFRDLVELEYPIGSNNHIDMVIFSPGEGDQYKEELRYLIELKHYSLVQSWELKVDKKDNKEKTHFREKFDYLKDRRDRVQKSKVKLSDPFEIVLIEMVLQYRFRDGFKDKVQNKKKYRFPQKYDNLESAKEENDIEKVKDDFERVFRDQGLYVTKTQNLDNEVDVMLHFFIGKM